MGLEIQKTLPDSRTDRMRRLAEACLAGGRARKTESSPFFEAFARRRGLKSRRALDAAVFRAMYGREPQRQDIQRVRFWRLGQHLPRSREEAVLLGQALDLSGTDLDAFLTEELCFSSLRFGASPDAGPFLSSLFREYLCQIPPKRLCLLGIEAGKQRHYGRHILYADAIDCIALSPEVRRVHYREHLYSQNFSGEFKKYFSEPALLSRETALRLLLLLLMPDVDADALNAHLKRLGFAALNPARAWNGHADAAVLGILEIADSQKTGRREADKERMKELLSEYDRLLVKKLVQAKADGDGCGQRLARSLRFMKFRSFGEERHGKEHRG